MAEEAKNFLEDIVEKDLASGRIKEVVTRFPPEPNGCLHIGHAKSITINFGIAQKYGGRCNLRFDDTNPAKEDTEFVESIQRDIEGLGYRWSELRYASDYFDELYRYAEKFIENGDAYVDDLSAEEIKATRGTLTEPGTESPFRSRTVEENLRLFREMREGRYPDGSKVLRAKIDMASPNMNMRDPVLYRILHATHHRTGDKWCIYPMYDFTHPISDALEGITHSICTLEFEDHRPLYDWVLEKCGFENPPHQYEFARLNLTNTIMSKRYLKKLVEDGVVEGWDDPRMPTLAGIRRRGYPAEAIRDFCERIGVAKANSEVDARLLEHCVREYLNEHAPRRMVVLDPLLVTIENYEGEETVSIPENPKDESSPRVDAVFGKRLYIDRSDFELDPPPKYYRLKPEGYVRLRGAYIVKCERVVQDTKGRVTELVCSYLPETKGGQSPEGVKAKGVIQWVNADDCLAVTVNRYGYLLKDAEYPGQDFSERFNPDSLEAVSEAKAERALENAKAGDCFQFLRTGYFTVQRAGEHPVFGEIVPLKDSFNK